jgi:superfamily II DNA helicase RecQ
MTYHIKLQYDLNFFVSGIYFCIFFVCRDSVDLKLKLALQQYNQDLQCQIECLRPLQVKAITAYLEKDTLVTLPTGYGKSLTYELLPYLEPECLLLVVVPVDAILLQELQKLGDKALMLTPQTLKASMPDIVSGKIKFAFSHPEVTKIKEVRHLLSTISRKTFIVVDEAHCVGMWGEEFRPAFRALGELRSVLRTNTMLALTATISPSMIKDLQAWLNMSKDFHHVATCPIRDNLYLEVADRDPSTGIH